MEHAAGGQLPFQGETAGVHADAGEGYVLAGTCLREGICHGFAEIGEVDGGEYRHGVGGGAAAQPKRGEHPADLRGRQPDRVIVGWRNGAAVRVLRFNAHVLVQGFPYRPGGRWRIAVEEVQLGHRASAQGDGEGQDQ